MTQRTCVFTCGVGLAAVMALLPGSAYGQGQALPDVKVNLPPSPGFDRQSAPEKYEGGELSVFGLRKNMSKYMDKDVRVKAYLLEVYECPEEQRKCNEAASKKAGAAMKKKMQALAAGAEAGQENAENKCRPCDQPHFFLADSPTTKKSRALVVADYPVKDWKTQKPRPLTADLAKVGQQYVVTGTFAINSITGFAASNGLIVHKLFQDLEEKVILEGNAVLPAEEQTLELEGQAPRKLLEGLQ